MTKPESRNRKHRRGRGDAAEWPAQTAMQHASHLCLHGGKTSRYHAAAGGKSCGMAPCSGTPPPTFRRPSDTGLCPPSQARASPDSQARPRVTLTPRYNLSLENSWFVAAFHADGPAACDNRALGLHCPTRGTFAGKRCAGVFLCTESRRAPSRRPLRHAVHLARRPEAARRGQRRRGGWPAGRPSRECARSRRCPRRHV